jgi:hypothetical protein
MELARIFVLNGADPWHKSDAGVSPQQAAADFPVQWADVPFLTRPLPLGLTPGSFQGLEVVVDFEISHPNSFSFIIPMSCLNSHSYVLGRHSALFRASTVAIHSHLPIDAICGWLAHWDFFTCTGSVNDKSESRVTFHVCCGLCGGHHGRILIKGNAIRNEFVVTAQAVCPHFFAARSVDSPMSKTFTVFTPEPSLTSFMSFQDNHPVRVISRLVCDAEKTQCDELLRRYLLPFRFGRSATQDHARNAQGTSDLKTLLDKLGGNIFIETREGFRRTPEGVLIFVGIRLRPLPG